MEFESILFELVVIFSGVAILATLFLFLKQPIIIAYIVMGMLVGPFGARVISRADHIEQISHLGIILLLFLIGLNLHPDKLLTLFRKAVVVTCATSLVFFTAFCAITLAFGFPVMESIIVGIALMFSSTIVGLKLTPTTTLHQRHLGEVMVSVLLLQDILAILIILFLEGSTKPELYIYIPLLILKGTGLVVFSFLFFKFCLMRLFNKYDTIQEYLLVMALGWCLIISGAAEALGMSYEIGAFIAGCSFALSPISLVISERLKPLREFFLILFFFATGAQFDLLQLKEVVIPGLVLAGVIVIIKPLIFTRAFRLSHEETRIAGELGFRLGQASEFSLLVTYMALTSAVISNRTAYLIQLTTVITFIVSTYIVTGKFTTPIASDKALRAD